MNRQIIKREINNILSHNEMLDKIILFGSRARGRARADSDWDLLILLNIPKIPLELELQIMHQIYNVELHLEQPISTLIYSTQDWENKLNITPLYQEIKNEGIILYEK